MSSTPGIAGTTQTVPQASCHQMRPVACGFISPSQSDRLVMYLAQQLLDQSVLVLLQVKIRSEIQVDGGPCSRKTSHCHQVWAESSHSSRALTATKDTGYPLLPLCNWSAWAQRETSFGGLFVSWA